MLRRVENVRLYYKPGWFGLKGWLEVEIGREIHRVEKIKAAEAEQRRIEARTFPVWLVCLGERTYWEFQGRFYWDNDDLTAEEVHALLVTRQQRQRSQIERAQAMVAMDGPRSKVARRDVIPDDVKQYVWKRDRGRCGHCGSQVEPQFDHVIPVASGGSSAAENLQILCGPCNRRKGQGLTVR